jgi:hypothetical protein
VGRVLLYVVKMKRLSVVQHQLLRHFLLGEID